MTILFELLLQLLGELVLQILAESGYQAMAEPFRPTPNPWLAAVGYLLFGAIAGLVSVAVFPDVFVRPRIGRIAMIFVVPIAAAAITTVVGAWRRGFRPPYRTSLFGHAYLLALAMSLARFFAAT